MRFKGTYVYAIVVFALAGWAIHEYKKEQVDEAQKTEGLKIIKTTTESVSGFEIKGETTTIVLEKKDDKWKISSPLEDEADDSTVRTLISTLFAENSLATVAEGSGLDLPLFGLGKPKFTFTIKTKDGKQIRYLIGSKKTVEENVYVKPVDENVIYLVGNSWNMQLGKTIKDLRNKVVFRKDIKDPKAIAISIKKPGEHSDVKIEQNLKSEWVVAGAVPLPADQDSVKTYIRHLESVKTVDFVSEAKDKDAAQFALSNPSVVIKIESKGSDKPLEFRMGRKDIKENGKTTDKYYAVISDENAILEISKANAETISKTADYFRDRAEPFKFTRADVSEIHVRNPKESLVLKRENEDWVLKDAKKSKTVDKDRVESLLDRLTQMRVEKFFGFQKGKGLTPPQSEILLKNAKGESLFSLKVGEKNAKEKVTLAKTGGSEELFGISTGVMSELPLTSLVKKDEKK